MRAKGPDPTMWPTPAILSMGGCLCAWLARPTYGDIGSAARRFEKAALRNARLLGESSLFPPSTGESATLDQRELCDARRLSVLTQRRGQLTHSSPHQPTRAVTFDPLFALNVIQNCSFFSSAACAVQCSAVPQRTDGFQQ